MCSCRSTVPQGSWDSPGRPEVAIYMREQLELCLEVDEGPTETLQVRIKERTGKGGGVDKGGHLLETA